MLSDRAKAAIAAVDHYPCGYVREWAARNWAEAVCPFMDEFIAAVRNRSAPVDEGYFGETSPAFVFLDVKAMDGMANGMREKTARQKSEIMGAVFFPYGQKWTDLLAAIQRRIGACAEVRAFKTRLALVADSIKLMFAESSLQAHAGTIWDLRRGMIEAFGALRDRVCSPTPATSGTRTRYPKDAEALWVLREGLRRSQQPSYRNKSDREIMTMLAQDAYGLRMCRGKLLDERQNRRERDPDKVSVARAAVQWGKYLSEFRKARG